MREEQHNFAEVWMALFSNDVEAIRHQLSIKRDFSIPNFSDDEAQEIWDSILLWCDAQ
jgi:hypothetical protein